MMRCDYCGENYKEYREGDGHCIQCGAPKTDAEKRKYELSKLQFQIDMALEATKLMRPAIRVAEQAPELMVDNTVFPRKMTKQLKKFGLFPQRKK